VCTASQAVQLLVSDWLLETRTELWQRGSAATATDADTEAVATTTTAVFADDLMSFQQDLATLRRLSHHWRAAMTKVSVCIVFRPRCPHAVCRCGLLLQMS